MIKMEGQRRQRRRLRKNAHPHKHKITDWYDKSITITDAKGTAFKNIVLNVKSIDYYKGYWTMCGTVYGGKYTFVAMSDGEYRSSFTYHPGKILQIKDIPYQTLTFFDGDRQIRSDMAAPGLA
jgi:hypothetical protein